MRTSIAASILAGIIVSCFAIYPEVNLRLIRGNEYQGAFATYDLDEMAYASYLQALIDGRPRKNDPYTGRDDGKDNRQPESIFSIQFITAYIAAFPASILGLSASEAMPLISLFSAFFSALALFWLIYSITNDPYWSLAAVLIVLCGGALVSGIGAIGSLKAGGVSYPFFPFLRRHIPGMSFPFLFAFLGTVWHGMNEPRPGKRLLYIVLSALCFGILVFSYFYLWTASAAFLSMLFILTLLKEKGEATVAVRFIFFTGLSCLLFLIPYFILISYRHETMDKAQLLVFTREFDVFRNIVIIGAVVAVSAAALALASRNSFNMAGLLFIASLGLTAPIVFNQQIITGRSLQPFHYEYYSVNYITLLSASLLTIHVLSSLIGKYQKLWRIGSVIAILAVSAWGTFEAIETAKFWDHVNIRRDEAFKVSRRLREIAVEDIFSSRSQITLNLDSLQADSQPTIAPQGVLWARHQHTFAGLEDWSENRERYYRLLYFSGLEPDWLRDSLTRCSNIESCMALFGWDRFNPTLSSRSRPLTAEEIENEVLEFSSFIENFDGSHAYFPTLSYVIYRKDQKIEFERLSRWYALGHEEINGAYVLRKLTPINH